MPFSSTTISSGPYTPNGVTSVFPYFFLALTEDEVQVVLTAADGTETLLTTGFEITNISNPDGGEVIFTMAPLYVGQTLTVRAVPSFAQEHDFQNQGNFNPVEINKALDRAAQRSIYLRDVLLAGGGVVEGGVTTVTWASVQGKPTVFTPAAHVHAGEDIASGTVASARIANLDASKIVSGAFDAARIPSLDASKLTTGILDPARLPVQSGGIVAATDIASLTAPQQALIVEGTLVTTSDGVQWRYSGTGSKVLEASYVELSTATDWSAITSKPANVTSLAGLTLAANKGLYATGVGTLVTYDLTATGRAIAALASQNAAIAYTSPLTTKGDLYTYGAAPGRLPVGVNGQVLTADSVEALGVKWANPPSGTGGSNMPIFTSVFSGNGDGVTSNNAAFTAAEASAYERIWLPEGNYLTTNALSTFNKRYEGPGKIFYGGTDGAFPGFARYATDVSPVLGPNVAYGLSESLEFVDATYKIVNTGTRKNFDRVGGFPPYLWAPAMGEFNRFDNRGGWSGYSGATTTAITAGVTTSVNVVGGSADWTVGQTIGFSTAMDGVVTETRVLTGVNPLTWSVPLSNTYPIGSVISHGYRTMNVQKTVILDHRGHGDAYCFLGRIEVSGTRLASQTSFEHGFTGGLIGGDLVLSSPMAYGTGWEMQYYDNGVSSTSLAGFVNSYGRKNNDGLYQSFWIHDLAKMDGGGTDYLTYGLKPLDGVYVVALAAKTGLDFTRSAFSVAAIALPREQKISLDAQISAPGPSNGNGWVATTNGNVYIYATTVSGFATIELQNNGYRMRLSAGGSITTNAAITGGSSIAAAGTLTASALQINDPSNGLFLEGGVLKLKKAGVVVQSW